MLHPTAFPRLDARQAAALRAAKDEALALSSAAAAETAPLQHSLGIPLGCLVAPLAAQAVQVSDPHASTGAAAATALDEGGGWRPPPPPPLVCRCSACNGYLNPFAQIWAHAAKWECNLCNHVNDLPRPPHPQHPQPHGQGGGGGGGGWWGGWKSSPAAPAQAAGAAPLGRLELVHADVEYLLSGEEALVYSTAADARPRVLVIALETTAAAVASGALSSACAAAKEALARIAADADADASSLGPQRVAVVSFDATARLHRLRDPSGGAPAVELMLPSAEGLPALPRGAEPPLYSIRERLTELQELLEQLPRLAAEASGDAAASAGAVSLEAAVEVARAIVTAAASSGDLFVLSVSGAAQSRKLPSAHAAPQPPDGKELAAQLERCTRPESEALKRIARGCADANLAVRLVAAPGSGFVDVASLAQLPKISGGRLFYVPPDQDGARPAGAALEEALSEGLSVSHAAVDAVLRLRTSQGLRVVGLRPLSGMGPDPEGEDGAGDDSIVLLPSVDRAATFAAELRHTDDKKALPAKTAYVQSALLYSGPAGERRIRVSTREIPVADSFRSLAQSVNPPVAIALIAKLALAAAETKPLSAVREQLKDSLLDSIVSQRELCPPPMRKTADELVLFRPLALFPLLTLALSTMPPLNTPSLASAAGPRSPDSLAAFAHGFRLLPTHLACLALAPRLLVVHERSLGDGWAPVEGAEAPPLADAALAAEEAPDEGAAAATLAPSAATREQLLPRGSEVSPSSVLLLDTLQELSLWVGAQASPAFLEQLFGTPRPADGADLLPEGANSAVDRMHSLLATLRSQRPSHAPLTVLVHGSPSEERFFSRLFANAYEPFLLQLLSDQRSRL